MLGVRYIIPRFGVGTSFLRKRLPSDLQTHGGFARINLLIITVVCAYAFVYPAHHGHHRRADKVLVNASDYLLNRSFYFRPWTESLQGVLKPMAPPLPKDHWAKKIKHLLKIREHRNPG